MNLFFIQLFLPIFHHKLSFSDVICAHTCIIHDTHLELGGEILFVTLEFGLNSTT